MKPYLLLPAIALAAALPAWPAEAVRESLNFDHDWRFLRGDAAGGEAPALDDRAWRKLNVPHDWSIEGPYSAANASGTGFLPGGIGWYRKTFALPEAARGRKISIEFDGVYRDSDVWINGKHLGHRPYGYSSFAYDLTPYLRFGTQNNTIAVRVDHSDAGDSRWYTGSGIYRHVRLVTTGAVHVAHWGTFAHTPVVRDEEALVTVESRVSNESKSEAAVRLVTSIRDAAGNEVATAVSEQRIAGGASAMFVQQSAVRHPALWSLERPRLYLAVTQVFAGGVLSDEYSTQFGIRSIRFDPNHGFFLNGKAEKLKGVCIHHDLGALGAAFNESALERRLKTLKDAGVNAIRCSHNPMAPELYDLCDRLGLLVMDEAFDEWTAGKHKWIAGWNSGNPGTGGYHEAFEEWSTRDIQDMVLRDRNHPSIVLWSIGNEIDYPGDPFGHPQGRGGFRPGMLDAGLLPLTARRLIGAVKSLDGTRPVTQALADILASNATGLAGLLDVTGYNYLEQHYAADHQSYPGRIILGSENHHSVAAWKTVAENEFVVGQFLWTGIDYLGEAGRYPDRGSTAGMLDYCGFRKPLSYLREALWSDRPMVYAAARGAGPARIMEHWNWAGDSRKTIPVEVYSNCASAELFLNGRSLGEKAIAGRTDPVLRWDVPNEPGTVRVLGKRDGAECARFELVTAGAPDHLELLPDRTLLHAGGSDLANIEIRVVDAAGRRVFAGEALIEVQVSGSGELAAVDSGNPRDVTPVQSNRRAAFEGRMLAIVRPGGQAGEMVVRVSAAGLKSGEARLHVQ